MTEVSSPPRRALPPIEFPESLPVSARRDEIARAISEHQVVIVCGETGSGKTTQLPKIALLLGRGAGNSNFAGGAADGARGRGKLIGHTQPRRLAASSVAKRIAEELKTPLGEVVGFKVRFQDRLSPGASVKLMTDGILLAETQRDPLLRAYDTLIIDEAHERSLNIDFLLGYLRQILPQRPDLKIIVTSATIDADRFAKHFASKRPAPGRPKPGDAPSGGSDSEERGATGHDLVPAPVIMVSGRLFPVEQRYRPFEERREYDLNDAITDAVDELWRGRGAGAGDVLVFLPGEREIREAAEHLRKHHPPGVDVLPLFARLSESEQQRIFEPHGAPRIVLATNVAETSLTVPGIRFVIDPGLARVKRYSYRNKVEQLQIEPISQAAANQRAGRCGRVADGICIRLYSEHEFSERPRFTDPEILRSSLAGVILRMKSVGLGRVEDFPFLEAPPKKAVADGYALLGELGAMDEDFELTPIGHELAKLPLDPRVGRMILAARDRQALHEVLIIASALSGQDVRDRPPDQQQQADAKHKPFDDERSEFMGYLKLWGWLEEVKGGRLSVTPGGSETSAPEGARVEHKLSHRKQEQRLRENFISPRRVREWRDIYSQLLTVVAEHGWRPNGSPATYEQVHLAMLAGLLGNVGCKSDDEDWYLGARGIKFWRHPGAHLAKKPGRWLIAAELVETTRLFGRGLAGVEPGWIEQVAGPLLKKQLLEPHWEKKAAEVVALERATLYGIVLYNGRRVNFGRVDPAAAREIFIREALVGEEWETKLPFLAHNRKLIRQVQELEHKSRRQDVLVDDELIFAFYEQQLPADVCSGHGFERWYREESKSQPKLLMLTRDELMRHEAAGITTATFPKTLRLGGVDCAVTYLHEPGDAKDGVTVTVPIYALNQVSEDRCEWLVPGLLKDKVLALVKSLHQRPRSRLVPLPDYAAEFCESATFGDGSLMEALLKAVRDRTQLAVQRNDFKLETLQPHLFMNFRVVGDDGRQLGIGRHLPTLKAELGGQARSAFQALAALKIAAVADARPALQLAPTGRASEISLRPPAREGSGRGRAFAPSAVNAPSGSVALAAARTAGEGTAPERFTDWSFGELPELMEIGRGGQTLVGFPALIDKLTHVEIEVFDEPGVAASKHRTGLRRLIALQIKEPLRYLEKNIPDLARMAVQFMALGGSSDELREQIIAVALDRAFLASGPLPANALRFKAVVDEGRARLNLVAQEVARLAATILQEAATAQRKLKDSKPPKDAADDVAAQLQRLVPKRFLQTTPYAQLQHLPRYLKGIVMRLDKLRVDPTRDTQRLVELRPIEQRWARRSAELKGAADARLDEFRWLLEELRISLFAQELRTPQPVSPKRLEKAWTQISA